MSTLDPTPKLLGYKDRLLFTTPRPDVVMERGEGSYLYDTTGKRYLDFICGWAVNTLGHSPAVICQALTSQASQLINASPAYYNRPMVEYAEQLVSVSGMDKVFFCSTGAEANETAIKLARKYGAEKKAGAYEIIALDHGFHGRSLATMSLSGKAKWKDLFAPKVVGFHHVPINDISALEAQLNKNGKNICAVFMELIQGEGGVHSLDKTYLCAVKKLADQHQVLLVFDEVQTGFARTGKLFAYEHYCDELGNKIRPDIMTLAKGMGGGFPVAAVLALKKCDLFEAGDNGGTYTGQPLAMAVGKAVLGEVIDQHLWVKVTEKGKRIKAWLSEMSKTYPITNIRGKGLLLGFTWNAEGEVNFKPEFPDALELTKKCFEKGLIINGLDTHNIRLIPALNVSDESIAEFFSLFSSVIKG